MRKNRIKVQLTESFVPKPTLLDAAVQKGYISDMALKAGTSWAQLYECAAQFHNVADFRNVKPTASQKRQVITAVICLLSAVRHTLTRPDYHVRLRHLNSHINSCQKGYHKGTRNQ